MTQGQLVNLVGQTFGRLKVIEFAGIKNGHSHWKCLCVCGKYTTASNGNLKKGNVSSCGCFRKDVASLPKGEAMFNKTYSGYKNNAKSRKLEFSLSKEQFRHIVSLNCFYCGNPPSNRSTRSLTNGDFIYNGIDRLDSSKGYVIDNVVPCCYDCNKAKTNTPYSVFKEWIFRVSDHMQSKEISNALRH